MTSLLEQHLVTLLGGTGVRGVPDEEYLLRSTGYALDSVELSSGVVNPSLATVLAQRRSLPPASPEPVSLAELGVLLVNALGCPGGPTGLSATGGPAGRAYPSAGALYPIEVLVLPLHVAGLEPRAWYYQPISNQLVPFGPPADHPATWFANPDLGSPAAWVVLWADFTRPSLAKYGPKQYRLSLLEAGHAMQNLVLVAAALGLPATPVAGFDDAALARGLGLDLEGGQPVLYCLAVGGRSRA
jgi:SagB-type dehydrogenase family enzyme